MQNRFLIGIKFALINLQQFTMVTETVLDTLPIFKLGGGT